LAYILIKMKAFRVNYQLHSLIFLFDLLNITSFFAQDYGRKIMGCHALSVPLPPMTTTAEHLPLARRAMEYFDKSTDPFHAVQTSIDLLKEAGFQELDEGSASDAPSSTIIQPGGKYFYTRNKSTLVAFAVGGQYQSNGSGGFKIIGGHTDSPNLKVKPRSKRSAKSAKSIQIGAECYGGGLWHLVRSRLGLVGTRLCTQQQQ
jgi:aspartyl aminopeptidase